MDKLYYIVCEERNVTLFEGRFQGRTRGAALKFLKDTLGRRSLGGLVFTITEIPVPLIREIVAEILGGRMPAPALSAVPIPVTAPAPPPVPDPPAGRFDAFAAASEENAAPSPAPEPQTGSGPDTGDAGSPRRRPGNPGMGEEFWAGVRAFWNGCRSIGRTAEQFGLSPNSVKTRARREGWNTPSPA